MSRMGNSVTGCASHFIYSQYHFDSVFLTNILDTLRHRKGTFVRCHSALHQSREYITDFDCKSDQKEVPLAFVLCCLLYFSSPCLYLSFPSVICPTRWFLMLVGLCALPCAFAGSIIRSRGHFDIYWLVSGAESLLAENRTVIWLWKIALLQYQLSMYCSVKAHYSWPICSVWRITVQTSVCTFYLDPLSHKFHSWCSATSLPVSAVCF